MKPTTKPIVLTAGGVLFVGAFYWLLTTHGPLSPVGVELGSVVRADLEPSVSGVGTVNSDANGNWTIAGTGGSRAVTSDLYGPYVDVNNIQGTQAAFSGTALEDTPLTVSFLDVNARKDERDTFDAVNDIHSFFETFAPGFPYTNARITARPRSSDCT